MRHYLFLIPILFVIIIPQVFATTTTTSNQVSFDGRTGSAVINIAPQIADSSGVFHNFLFFNNTNSYTIPTGYGTYVFVVSSCGMKLYPPVLDTTGVPPLVNSFSYTVKNSPLANSNFTAINLTNSTCTSSVIQAGDYLQINGTKSNANATLTVSYTIIGGNPLKASYYLTPKQNGKYWQVIESQSGIPNTIRTANATYIEKYNLPSNTTVSIITNSVLSGNKIFLLDAVGNIVTYDYQTSSTTLSQTGIAYDVSTGKAALFNNFKSSIVIPANSTFSIDPTYGFTAGNNWQVLTTQTVGAACGTPTTKQNLFNDVTIPDTTTNQACTRMAYQFPIGTLNNTIVDKVQLQFDDSSQTNGRTCDINNVSDQPSSATANTLWNDIGSGTSLVASSSACQSVSSGNVIDLGANGVTSVQNRINNAVTNNWFAVGIKSTSEVRDVSLHSNTFGSGTVKLLVSYHTSTPSKPLNIAGAGHPHKNTITYTKPSSKGSSNIINYNLYRTSFPYAGQPFPDGQGSDPESYVTKLSMSNDLFLQHFDSISNNYYNDTSGSNNDIKRIPPSNSLANDLKEYYKFDETGGTIYNKASFANYTTSYSDMADGTKSGTITYSQTGKIKQAVTFGGGHFIIGTNKTMFNFMHQTNYHWTFTTWYKLGTPSVAFPFIFAEQIGSATNIGSLIEINNNTGTNRIAVGLLGSTTCAVPDVVYLPRDHNYHFLAINASKTRVGSEVEVMVDNANIQRLTGCGVPAGGTPTLNPAIGDSPSGGDNISATFDEMAFWNRLLTPAELTTLYNSGKGISLYSSPDLNTNGKFASGAFYDGANTALNFTSTKLPKNTNSFTIMGWNYFNNTSNPLNMLAYKNSVDKTVIQVNGTYGSIYNGGQFLLQCPQTRHVGHWNFDAFTYDGATFKYYSNGTLSCSNASGVGISTATNNNYTIGIGPITNTKIFNGTIDELAILNRTMSATEIVNAWMRGNFTLNLTKEVGNVTSIDDTGLGNATSWYYRTQAINSNGNGTLSDVTNSTTSFVPSKPASVTPVVVGLTRIDVYCTPPTSDGHDPIQSYQIKRNGTILVNSTTSLCAGKYTDQPINVLDAQTYSVCAWNGVGCGAYTTAVSSTVLSSSGVAYINQTTVGNVIGIQPRVFITTGIPDPSSVNVMLYNYTTLLQNHTISTLLPKGNTTYIPYTFYTTLSGGLSNFTSKVRITNTTGFVTLTSNFTTATSSYHYSGSLNYTISRPDPFSNLHVSVLRQPITFKIECNYKTGVFDAGFWHNFTGVGYYDKTDQVQSTDTVYISCYNDQLLFSVVSYGNLNGTSLIHSFQSSFGLLFGVPVVMLFLIFLAAIGTGRSASTIFIMWGIALGIMDFLQFFPTPIAPWVWGAVVLFIALGIMRGKQLS